MLIDIHAHINNEKLIGKIDDVISRAKENNVGKIVCAGCDYQSSIVAINLSKKYNNVYATIGAHPNYALSFDKKMKDLILSCKDNKKVVAIGEIGLDYYDLEWQIDEVKKLNSSIQNISREEFIEAQKQMFQTQIELAHQVNLPVMIHMRDATSDTLKILEANKNILTSGGLLHCYNGSIETTMRVFGLGFYISLGGAITFKNAHNMPSVLREIGLDRVTLETDCPYLCPEPFRGQINEPANIPLIANKISNILEMPVDEVEKRTTENCYKVFPNLLN